jgi:hypothetical protein
MALEVRFEGDFRIDDAHDVSLQMLVTAAQFLLGPSDFAFSLGATKSRRFSAFSATRLPPDG